MREMSKNPRIETLVAESLLMMRVVDKIDDDGECWMWAGALSNEGHPIIHLRQPVYGHTGCLTVRRFVWLLTHGILQPRAPIGCTCGEKLCVNPAHLYQSTVSKVGKIAAKNGAWKGRDRAIKISMTKRASAKLDIEKAREIRLSLESGPALAARYGVHKSLINGIKRGTVWRDHSSPFAALGARA